MPHPKKTSLPERVGIREVLDLSWPIMVSMVSFTVMTVVDTIFVARLGTAPLAAIGLAASVTFLFLAFALGLLRGTRVVVAQSTGAGDEASVDRSVWQALWLAWLLGAVIASMAPLGELIFHWMGGSSTVVAHADGYYTVRVLGGPITFTLVALNAWFEGRGDTRTPMVATLISNGLNIALDPLFIFGWGVVPAMGTAGAAAATVIACAFGAAFSGFRVHRALRGRAVPRAPNLDLLREIVRIGLPMGVSRGLEVGAWVVFVGMLARVGEAHLAAHVIVVRIVSLSFLPGMAVGEAASVFVGQAVGAKRPEIARQAWRAATVLALGIMTGFGVIFVLFPGVLVAVFNAEPEVVEIARSLLWVAAAFQVFDAVAMVALTALTGAGDTRYVMVISVLGSWLLNLPLAWLLAVGVGLGAPGAWMGLCFEIIVLAAVAVHRIRSTAWLEARIEAAQQAEQEKARARAA